MSNNIPAIKPLQLGLIHTTNKQQAMRDAHQRFKKLPQKRQQELRKKFQRQQQALNKKDRANKRRN